MVINKRIKVFFDLEFTGLFQGATAISLALVAETGETFYAEFSDYNKEHINPWVAENVIPHLKFRATDNRGIIETSTPEAMLVYGDCQHVAIAVNEWLYQFPEVEIWGDCLHYDWVVFSEIFGGATHLPTKIHYIPGDICTLFKLKGIDPDIEREVFAEMTAEATKHSALWDAQVIKECYFKLVPQAAQDRVRLEYKELQDRLSALNAFLESKSKEDIVKIVGTEAQYTLLKDQAKAMEMYRDILTKRITLF